jgi:vacuolar-type H+-ATPase subunit E/Vma4
MEIIQSDENIRNEIISEARASAEEILKKVKDETGLIREASAKEIEAAKNEYENNFKNAADEKIKLLFSSIDIEVKKLTGEHAGKIIEGIYDKIKSSIVDNSLINYKKFIVRLIENAATLLGSMKYFIDLSKAESERISKDEITNSISKNINIENMEISDALNDGLLLYSSDRKSAAYISLDKFIRELKEETRLKIYDMLIRGK